MSMTSGELTLRPARAAFIIALASCAAPDAPHAGAVADVDTLPSGAISVMSSGPSGWADTNGWRLVEAARIESDFGTEGELVAPGSVALGDGGTVYVADTKPAAIKVYTPDGKFVRSIGREGEGPGEFRVAFLGLHGASLVVHDPQLARTTVFDTAGTLVRSWSSTCCVWAPMAVDGNGLIYLPALSRDPEANGSLYTRYSLAGDLVDTVGVPPRADAKRWELETGGRRRLSSAIPFAPMLHTAFDPAGGFVYGWSGEYRLVSTRTGTDTVQLFGRFWTPPPIRNELREEAVADALRWMGGRGWDDAALRRVVKLSDVPSTGPAFELIMVDLAGNRWVRLPFSEDGAPGVFDVFDSSGVYLGAVPQPRGSSGRSRAWSADGLVVLNEDRDGLPIITRFRIDKP